MSSKQQARGKGGKFVRNDCGPGGGCGPAPGWVGGPAGIGLSLAPLGAFVGLTRLDCDILCVDMLMRNIVKKLVDDALVSPPSLSGESGELSGCVSWLDERGWNSEMERALIYSRRYGGGGVVMAIDDGRPPEEEVDLLAVRDVMGFYALPKFYLTPADAGSSRFAAGWYGPRIGRPEHYIVTPQQPVGAADTTGDLLASAGATAMGLRAGMRFHRSRVVAWPYCDELDLRQARRFPNWNGWGPGAVESCVGPYLARREGGFRTNSIMRSVAYNVLTTPNVAGAQANPSGGDAINNAMSWVQFCLANTAEVGLPLVAVDPLSSLEPKAVSITGLPDLLKEQRRFLLDNLPEYVEVALFGSSNGGLSGDGKEGEWRAYFQNLDTYRSNHVWRAGTFGGGMKQAVMLAQAARCGPTRGVVDRTVRAVWPPLWRDSAEARSKTRKANAEARAIDRAVLGLTPDAMLRHDDTLAGNAASDYPSLDVDDGLLPQLDPGVGEEQAVQAVAPGAAAPTTTAASVQAVADDPSGSPATPRDDDATSGASAGGIASPAAPQAPVVLPSDIVTEVEVAAAFRMTKRAAEKFLASHPDLKRYAMPPGTRGGARYSMADVMAAWNASAQQRVDSLRQTAANASRLLESLVPGIGYDQTS